MVKKIIGIVVVLCLALLLVLIFRNCKKSPPTETSPKPEILSQDSNVVMQKLKDNIAKAKEAAIQWKGNAQFVALVIKISPEMKIDTSTETYVFGSSDDPNNWWTYSVSELNGQVVRSLTPKDDYLGTDFQPIKEDYFKISYIDALNTAEDSGGTIFRADNLDSQINIVLAQTNPKNWLWWQVEYAVPDSNLQIFINATDGKMYDENGELSV